MAPLLPVFASVSSFPDQEPYLRRVRVRLSVLISCSFRKRPNGETSLVLTGLPTPTMSAPGTAAAA